MRTLTAEEIREGINKYEAFKAKLAIRQYRILEKSSLKAGKFFIAEYYYNLRKELETAQ